MFQTGVFFLIAITLLLVVGFVMTVKSVSLQLKVLGMHFLQLAGFILFVGMDHLFVLLGTERIMQDSTVGYIPSFLIIAVLVWIIANSLFGINLVQQMRRRLGTDSEAALMVSGD